ncbi:MAG TPA: hypothetical protein VER03_17615 [Bryobacteraceae bacterium]|nr:hypothetical protein [Bryobacteraceae bacterium]
MTEDDIRRMLRDLREEPVPPDSLARVRMAVDERLTRRSRTPWLAAAFATLTLAGVATFMPRPAALPLTPSPARVVAHQPTPAPLEPVTLPARAVAPKQQRIRRPASRRSESMVIRIETPDPDVLILLVGD